MSVKHSGLTLFALIVAGCALALVAVSCAGTPPPETSSSAGPSSGVGPGISVSDALASRLEGPLLVNGWLWSDGKNTRLCTGLTASTPPQCAEPSLTVSGVDLSQTKGLQSAQGVSWSTEAIQMLGEVSNGTIRVSGRSKA